MTGRALAVMADLGADLQPAGWRLTDAPGIDHRKGPQPARPGPRRAGGAGAGLPGAFKVQVAGPWTLAAIVERPRGDKVLADFGARRELAQALAEGSPPTSPTCAAGCRAGTGWWSRSTSRRWSRCCPARCRPRPASAGTAPCTRPRPRRRSAGCSTRSPAPGPSRGCTRARRHAARPAPGRGRPGLSVDQTQLSARDHDELAGALDAGETVAIGVVPSTDPAAAPTDAEVTESVLALDRDAGLDQDQVERPTGAAPRPAAWPAPRRHGPAPRSSSSGGRRPRSKG